MVKYIAHGDTLNLLKEEFSAALPLEPINVVLNGGGSDPIPDTIINLPSIAELVANVGEVEILAKAGAGNVIINAVDDQFVLFPGTEPPLQTVTVDLSTIQVFGTIKLKAVYYAGGLLGWQFST